jgi:FMN phosphatase YigB (HAD superfamily)
MMKKILISLSFFLLGPIAAKPYLIIWDLGDTLVYVSLFRMVVDIGFADCAWYHAFHTKEKNQLQNLLFDVLEEFGGKQTCPDDQKSYHTAHRPLPQVMCDWLAGRILEPKILVKALGRKIKELYGSGYFRNNLEYRIVKSAVGAMFNPEVLVKNTKLLKEALEIVQEIAHEGIHQQTILSNWDGVSYTNFKNSPTGQELSRYFNMDDVIISGSLNTIKPQQTIFDQCLNRYGFAPEDCIFIDDQKENVEAARSLGFKAIQIKHYDFKQLRKELTALGVL